MTLHAMLSRMVAECGLAVLAILGNVVTAWSWFGVNMLSVGLHSYGFMSGAGFWLLVFVFSQCLLAGLGMLPLSWWASGAAIIGAAPARGQRAMAGRRPAEPQPVAGRVG